MFVDREIQVHPQMSNSTVKFEVPLVEFPIE